MPDVIRHPVFFWMPAFAGMTSLSYLTAGVIAVNTDIIFESQPNSRYMLCWEKKATYLLLMRHWK
jgi:hypothetical protein